VIPEYLSHLLNTPQGYAYRRAVMTGISIPRITEILLRESTLYLLPRKEQENATDALHKIHLLQDELNELEYSLWDKPRQISKVQESVKKINHEERFQDWLESLPFPLASILRAYHTADQNDKDKYLRLLHFFEALAAFCATIHLSACRSDPQIWDHERERIIDLLKKEHSFNNTSFGLWQNLVGLLASDIRELLNSKPEDVNLCLRIYCMLDPKPLEILCSKKLLTILQRANYYRNRWPGHGGAVSPKEARARHDLVRSLLDAFRNHFGTIFSQYQLIEPGQATIQPGPIYNYKVRCVMGSNPMLEYSTVKLTEPAITGQLYFYSPGNSRALGLEPLVQLRGTPQSVCYFFNHMENDYPQLVSYHFADVPTIEDAEHKEAIAEFLKEFAEKNEREIIDADTGCNL
jgi:hypothetical protein